jgi:hypothetical protein
MTDPFWGEPIFSYSRRHAIADGILIDVTGMAREAGFKYPVALTCTVWNGYIVPDEAGRAIGQSEQGRLWDTLWMLHVAIGAGGSGSEVSFRVIFLRQGTVHEEVTLKCLCGPGDDPSPVLTIMLPDED